VGIGLELLQTPVDRAPASLVAKKDEHLPRVAEPAFIVSFGGI
jgi:hypothetical protein